MLNRPSTLRLYELIYALLPKLSFAFALWLLKSKLWGDAVSVKAIICRKKHLFTLLIIYTPFCRPCTSKETIKIILRVELSSDFHSRLFLKTGTSSLCFDVRKRTQPIESQPIRMWAHCVLPWHYINAVHYSDTRKSFLSGISTFWVY